MTRPEAAIRRLRDPLTLAIAAHEKAIALRAATRLSEAEVACRRALACYVEAEGARHPDVANALVELGQILEARDRPRPARSGRGEHLQQPRRAAEGAGPVRRGGPFLPARAANPARDP